MVRHGILGVGGSLSAPLFRSFLSPAIRPSVEVGDPSPKGSNPSHT